MTPEQQAIADAATRLFKDTVDRTRQWELAVDMGLPTMLAGDGADDHGSVDDVLPVLLASGEYAARIPLAETILANWCLRRAGEPPLATSGTVVLGDALELDANTGPATLTGSVARVPAASTVDVLVVLHRGYLGIVESGHTSVSVAAHRNLADEPRDTVTLDAVPLETSAPAGLEQEVRELAALFRAAQIAGAARRALWLTTAHVRTRRQFSRPLIQFQAVQQSLSRAAAEVEAAHAAVHGAFASMATQSSETSARLPVVATAKSRASRAAGIVAAIAHQLHGAIGVTEEYHLHSFTRRLWAWRDEDGDEVFWETQLGRWVRSQPRVEFWEAVATVEPVMADQPDTPIPHGEAHAAR